MRSNLFQGFIQDSCDMDDYKGLFSRVGIPVLCMQGYWRMCVSVGQKWRRASVAHPPLPWWMIV
jgi:hypothetical protein